MSESSTETSASRNSIDLFKGDYTRPTEQFKNIKLEVKWLMATIDDYQLKPLADLYDDLSSLGFPMVLPWFLRRFSEKNILDQKCILSLFDLAYAALPSTILKKVTTFLELYSRHLCAGFDHYDLTFGQIEKYMHLEEGMGMDLDSYEEEERLYNQEDWDDRFQEEIEMEFDVCESNYDYMYDEEEMEVNYSDT